ncbi:MAG: sulfotransferase domain-containing protein [Planctomycetota bacterium]
MASRLPDFIMIGSAKCGTTSLCDDLDRHPDIGICTPKEPEFFCRPEQYAQGLDWYTSLFESMPKRTVGDGSTQYTNRVEFPGTAEKIATHCPDAKLIMLVRNPVERCYSYWLQKLKNQDNFGGDADIPRDPDRALVEGSYLVESSKYIDEIREYTSRFDPSQLCVVIFERYKSDRAAVIRQLCAFLGEDPAPLLGEQAVHSNRSADHFATEQRTRIADAIKSIPGLGAIRKALPKQLRRRVLDASVSVAGGSSAPPRMSAGHEAMLRTWLWPSVRQLEDHLGEPIPEWASCRP